MTSIFKSSLLLLASTLLTAATPTEEMEWESTSGHKTIGKALSVHNENVQLQLKNGKKVNVPLNRLTQKNQDFLKKHFNLKDPVVKMLEGSGAETAKLEQEMGKVLGPITTPDGSNYLLYIPTTLKQGRKAPLLFITSSGGGKKKIIEPLAQGAELTGSIMAMSMESKNRVAVGINHKHCANAINHIKENLPIDEDQIYFTGSSGGAAMAFINSSSIKAAGVMPNVGYVPSGFKVSGDNFFIITGAKDYNRYTSASANARFGEKAIHRLFPGGHSHCPPWIRIEGMLWLNGRYLAKNKDKHPEQAADYEASMLKWMADLKETHRAYYFGRFLLDEYEIQGVAKTHLEGMMKEWETDSENVRYYKGIMAIDELSKTHFSKIGGGSQKKHLDKELSKETLKVKDKFIGAPEVEELLQMLSEKTV